jgi:hypothetical protein
VRPGDLTEARAEPEDVVLTDDRRAELIAAVEGNSQMPEDAKARVIEQLQQDRVPVQVIERIEARMGG